MVWNNTVIRDSKRTGLKAMLSGGDEELSWQHLAWNSVLHDMRPSLDFIVFRVKREKVGFTEGLSAVLTTGVLQVRGLSEGSLCTPIPEYNLILHGFNLFFLM